jgi:hypothetical protein
MTGLAETADKLPGDHAIDFPGLRRGGDGEMKGEILPAALPDNGGLDMQAGLQISKTIMKYGYP